MYNIYLYIYKIQLGRIKFLCFILLLDSFYAAFIDITVNIMSSESVIK